jgi:hypothetical protein
MEKENQSRPEEHQSATTCSSQGDSCSVGGCPLCRPPVLLAIVGVFALLIVAQSVWARLTAIKRSEPYRLVLEELKKSAELQARLGSPIQETSWIPGGTLYTEGDRGEASLAFKIAGPKGEGEVMAQARRLGGRWALTFLEVRLKDGSVIKLLPPLAIDTASSVQGGTIEEAPRWVPPSPESSGPQNGEPVPGSPVTPGNPSPES